MDCVSPIVNFIKDHAIDAIVKEIRYAWDLEKNMDSLRAATFRLKEKECDIKREVAAAQANRYDPTHQVQGWLKRVESIKTRVEADIRDFGQRQGCLGIDPCPNLPTRYCLGRRVVDHLGGVEGFIEESLSLGFVFDPSLPAPLETNMSALRAAMEKLLELEADVRHRVDIARAELWAPKSQVQGWLLRVEGLKPEVEQLQQKYYISARKPSISDGVLSDGSVASDTREKNPLAASDDGALEIMPSYELHVAVEGQLRRVNELTQDGASISEVADPSHPAAVVALPTTHAIGQHKPLKQLRSLLRENRVGIVGVVGAGGVGKTTLLKRINNEMERTCEFDVVIWVVVAKQVNVYKIRSNIAARLGVELKNDPEKDQLVLYNALRSKRFLLMLDDVWEGLNLESIGIPTLGGEDHEQNHNLSKFSSKVIFTTRFQDICSKMGAKVVTVDCLVWKEAWELFEKKVGEDTLKSSPEIRGLAERVAKECGGLPLALTIIGEAMSGKMSPQEWKHSLNTLYKSASGIAGADEKLLNSLKLSYDYLPNDTMKNCFLYCALFPEDFSIAQDDLIWYWMGEGFLDGCDSKEDAYNMGHSIIQGLKRASLLENGEKMDKEVKMHDLIRDMALWIASECGNQPDKCVVKANAKLLIIPEAQRWKTTERMSLMNNNIKKVTSSLDCPNLLTLMLQRNYKLGGLPDDLFMFMPIIRVLDLSDTGIKNLPDEIGRLVELRYFNLSRTKITVLPKQIAKLQKLNHLNLEATNELKALPLELGDVESLEHLNLNSLQLSIPRSIISRLLNLKIFYISGYIFKNIEEDTEINVRVLEQLTYLEQLQVRLQHEDILKMLATSHMVAQCLTVLFMTYLKTESGHCKNTSIELLSYVRSMSRLQELRLESLHSKEISDSKCSTDEQGNHPFASILETPFH